MDQKRASADGTVPEIFQLTKNGWMPNNVRLPVKIYRAVITDTDEDTAVAMESLFRRNGWPPQWRNGVYSFHHYHTRGHEVLGFAGGNARLVLGGADGIEVDLQKGDIALLPAGTGHCLLKGSPQLLVIGAYPPGQEGDICRTVPSSEMLRRIATLPNPKTDPVSGE